MAALFGCDDSAPATGTDRIDASGGAPGRPGPDAEAAPRDAVSGAEDHGAADRDAEPPEPCADAPFDSWETFGRGFLTTWCSGCHAATAAERFGAPPEVVFDTLDDARGFRDRLVVRAATEPITMPPAGGVDADELTRLRAWLTCGDIAASP